MKFAANGTPSEGIVISFIQLCTKEIDKLGKAVAIHCQNGLGPTGMMAALYLMYKYRSIDAKTAISWLRICRPGSVIGKQQDFV